MDIDKIQKPKSNRDKQEIDEENSDGSANAFEGTELVSDAQSQTEQPDGGSKRMENGKQVDDFNAY